MKKIYLMIMTFLILFIVAGCSDKEPNDDNGIIDITDYIELIEDPSFSTGFHVLGYSPVVDGRSIKMIMDYNGNAVLSERKIWQMAQWWTPYNLVDSQYRYDAGKHIYQTQSRTIEVNSSDNGYLRMELLGSEEFLGTTRKSGEPWPHALIEQNFSNSVKMTDLKALVVSLEFSVEKVIDHNGSAYNPSMHAAQLLWYFTLRNVINENDPYEQYGQNGDFLWFGVPLYDNRSDFVSPSAHVDTGAPGTTNKIIFSMGSREYLNEKIQMGKTYTIEVDILPYLKEAFIYAISNNALVNCQFKNMEIGYMNFGWELPGAFDVASTIKNMSAKAIMK